MDYPPLVAVCTSCRQLHPDQTSCNCVLDRAEAVAQQGYELHRVTVPRWRRGRPWDELSERSRQELIGAGLDLVEVLEDAGWRLVLIGQESAHSWPEEQGPDPYEVQAGAQQVIVHVPAGPDWPQQPARNEYDFYENNPFVVGTARPVVPADDQEPAYWPVVPADDQEPAYAEFDTAVLAPVVPRYAREAVPAPVDPRTPITDPPMLQGVTLREWLVHHHPHRDHVWEDVVREFYARAADSPPVASFFHEVLARSDGWETLQRHFLAALVMVTGQGVTAGTLQRMDDAHQGVRNTVGQAIDGATYDAVIGVLVDVLRAFDVPAAGIAALAVSIRPLRDVIVRDEDTTPGGLSVPGAPHVVR